MIEELYNYLKKIGFTRDDCKYFEDRNEKVYFTDVNEVEKNILFLTEKGLLKEEILEVIRINPYMLTVKSYKLDALDNIYKELGIKKENIKKIIILNPYAYTESPIELQKIIDYLKARNINKENIIKIIFNNPKILDLSLDEFKEIIE